MKPNPFSHVDLRVSSAAEALPFYQALMPELGFTRRFLGTVWKVFAAEGDLPSVPYFGFTEEAGHRPSSCRVAFWVASAEKVDRLAAIVRRAGGRNISGPRRCPEYSASYYAVFFEDPCGNKLEILFRTD